MDKKANPCKKCVDKLFGGLKMSWIAVVLFAIATALLTALFLTLPFFDGTSFALMGSSFQAWILFAVIIMSNCKKPLESALKTFVFFLISQPLIYLFQVPFSALGWQIFIYYRYWFIWTLITFPMAFIGWYIVKKNLISLLILTPVLVFLTSVYVNSFILSFRHFPRQLIDALFCLAQVILYLYVFTPKLWQRLIGFFIPLAVIMVIVFMTPEIDMTATDFLPDNPVLTEAAVAVSDNPDMATVTVTATGEDSMIMIKTQKYGTSTFTIKDNDKEYRYSMEVYEDDGGHAQINIIPIKN